jgi:hypothetical protein
MCRLPYLGSAKLSRSLTSFNKDRKLAYGRNGREVIFRAPNDSPAHLALRRCAPSTLQEPLRHFLWEINAHCDLIALYMVCQNIQSALAGAMQDWDAHLSEWQLDDWNPILEWINKDENRGNISRQVGNQVFAGFVDGKHPLMGKGIERYPVYAAMCNSQEADAKSDLFRLFRLLQGHLLIAHVLATRDHTELKEFEEHSGKEELLRKRANPYFAAYAVRDLSRLKSSDLLSKLLVESAPDDFVVGLHAIAPGSFTATKRLNDLVLFFEKAVGNREQGTRAGGGGGAGFGERIHGGKTDLNFEWELNDRDDQNQNQSQHSTVRRVRVTREKRDELLDLDDYPFDDVEDELGTSEFDDRAYQSNPGAYQEASTAQLNHVVMANQMFPWSYGTLALAELDELMKRSNALKLIASNRELSPRELDELELLALVNVMFWTGNSLERARRLNYFGFPAANRNVNLALIPATDKEIPRWRIAAPLPTYRRPQPEVSDKLDRAPFEYLELPDVADASRLVLELIRQRSLHGLDRNVRSENAGQRRASALVFWQKKNWYETGLKKLTAGRDPQSRITKTRISSYLFSRILQATKNDYVVASIVTGRDLPLARVRLFYACPSANRLQSVYVKTAAKIRGELDRILGVMPTERPLFSLEPEDSYIGNRLCPKIAAVRVAIGELIQRISDLSNYQSDEEYRQYHNYYTLYTIMMFAYSTGIRGIRTPYLDPGEIFQSVGKNGVSVITDKDSGIGYKAKLAWIPPSLMKHMEYHSDFVSRSPFLYEAQTRNWPCFFIKQEMKGIEEVRPGTLATFTGDFIQQFLPFPANIHRRFVSSELLDRGCPAEVVEAWMGHWHRGEEWWGPSSSLTFKQYCEALRFHLVPLLENEIGFRPIKGDSTIRVPNE